MASGDLSDLGKELEKISERKGKLHMEGEDSHSSVSDLHRGQHSSLTDSGQRDDITDEDKSLISHAFLFPFDHEFTKEDLIRLWIAEGLFQIDQNPRDRVEDDAGVKFDSFVQRKLIVRAGKLQELVVPIRPDPAMDFHKTNKETWIYKLHKSVESSFGPTISDDGYFRISDANFRNVPESATHLCIFYRGFNDMTFDDIKGYVNLRTLFIRPHQGYLIKVPFYLFSDLKKLTTMNFSYSYLCRLPFSIKYLQSLRYIDLSYTHINWLPGWIERLRNLQTLKLRGCFSLYHLPHNMWKLTNLRHLDFDVRQLQYMPPRIGNLTHLQTLSAFLIGKEVGRRIRELKNLGNLTGSFCISRLENVLDLKDVMEAALIEKNYITTLVLRWTEGNRRARNSPDDEEILEHLRPSLRVRELRIIHYGGTLLPTWIGDRSYECLVDLTLYGFNNCRLLPSLGDLPSLRFLHMAKMNKLRRIDQLFCRYGRENSQDHAFPRLETLAFKDMPKWEEWTGVQSGDFPSLHNLHLENCHELKSLPSLSCIRKSLKKLELSYCQNITPFLEGEGEEPVSLEYLYIYQCPELKKCFNRSHGRDWPKIAHVAVILIDGVNTGRGGRFV